MASFNRKLPAGVRTGIAHVASDAATLGDAIDGVIHGHGACLETHVPWPQRPTADRRLWVVAQDWAGRTHTASWALPKSAYP